MPKYKGGTVVTDLEKELTSTLNRFSAENASDTPDFILAAYLIDCLKAFNRASVWRGKWYSADGVPASERHTGPEVSLFPVRKDPSAEDLDAVAEEQAVSGEVFPSYGTISWVPESNMVASWTPQERAMLGQASDKLPSGPGLACKP
jgi:hypothetical protein